MTAAEAVLCIDVGTTASKAALIARGGEIVGAGTSQHSTSTPRPGWVEQDANHWWRSTCQAVAEALAAGTGHAHPVAIAVTGQMQDLIALDGSDALGPAILYSDHRAAPEHEQLLELLGADAWLRWTANAQDESNLAAKWLWLRNHQAETVRRTSHLLLGAHSYVVWRLSGRHLCDPTTASTTGLFDFVEGGWSSVVLAACGLDVALLPELVGPASGGQLSDRAAGELALPAGIPVIHASGDAATTTIGVGAGAPGARYAYLGTSGWVAGTVAGRPQPSEAIWTLRHPAEWWVIRIGPMLSVGSALDWARGAIALDGGHDPMERAVSSVGPRPSSVLFLPHLAGERSPFRDADARGAFVGISTSTSRAELLRSVLDGVAFALRAVDTHLGEPTDEPLLVCGGGSRSDTWCQVLANAFGRPVWRVRLDDAGLLGAYTAACAALAWAEHSPEAARQQPLADGDAFAPTEARAYADAYAIFENLYPALRPSFREMAGLQAEEPPPM